MFARDAVEFSRKPLVEEIAAGLKGGLAIVCDLGWKVGDRSEHVQSGWQADDSCIRSCRGNSHKRGRECELMRKADRPMVWCLHTSTEAAHELQLLFPEILGKLALQCSFGKMFCELYIAAADLFTGLRDQSLSTTTCQNLGRLSMSGMSVGCFQAVVQIYMNEVTPRQAEKAYADQQTD